MNIFEQEDVVKGMPDQRLMMEVQRPSGSVPQYLVVSEIQRRADMRKRFAAQQKTPSTTVKDQIVSGGIADMAPRQPSIGGMTSSPPSPMQPMAPQQAMPQPAAPVRMATPPPVRMFDGKDVPFAGTQDMYDKNIGGFRDIVDEDPDDYPMIRTSSVPNTPTTFQSLTESAAALMQDMPDATPDFSLAREASDQRRAALKERLDADPADYSKFVSDYTPDFSRFKPDFSELIDEQERLAEKIRQDAKKESGAQALIRLGAGIMEGDTALGLREAGQSAATIMRDARKDISAADRLKNEMKVSAQNAAMELGVLGEKATMDKLQRDADIKVAQYKDDRARELALLQIDEAAARDELNLEVEAAKALNAASIKNYELALDTFVKQGALLRYSDLASAEDKANLRAALDAIEGPLKEELKAWRQENEDASPEAFKTFLLTTMDTLISALPSEISGGITPRAITGKLVDSRLGIDPVSNSEVGEGNKRIEFTSQGKRKDEQ
jgi:hypothetical protein